MRAERARRPTPHQTSRCAPRRETPATPSAQNVQGCPAVRRASRKFTVSVGSIDFLRAKTNIRIEPVPPVGPGFHERAPHRCGIAGESELEIDRFLPAALRLGGMRRVWVHNDELLP